MTLKFKTIITNKIILTILILNLTKTNGKCTGIYFDGKYYEITPIKEDINNITQLSFNRNNGDLYFTFNLLDLNKAVGYINMKTKEVGTIQGVKEPNAIAIDDRTGETYIGGASGVFLLNDKKVSEKLPNIEDNVTNVFFKNGLYYTNSKEMAFEYVHGMATKVPELFDYAATKILIDDDRNIFFLQDKKLFRIKIGTRAVNSHERYTVDCISNDVYNRAYFCTNDGVYRYNKYKYALEKVSNIKAVKGLTFDVSNDAIIILNNAIYKLNLRSVAC